jgi:hypothetical protein
MAPPLVRLMPQLAALVRMTAVLACSSVLGCSEIRSKTDSFRTLDEARAAGAVEQGWLPEGLPPGTREIRIAHVPDTTKRWGIINFPSSEAPALKALLAAAEVSFTGQVVDIPARIEWWPVTLRGTLDDERVRATGLRGYRSRDGQRIFAVNWNQGRAYYWPAG